MMAVTEGKIRVTADTSDAQRALGNLEKALDNLKGSTGAAAKAFAAITGAAAGIAYVVKQTVDAAGSIMDAANAIGVSASSLNTLQTAAGLAGVGAEQLNSSLIKLNKSIGEGLSKGTGPAVDGLKKLGVPIAEIARMRPDQQFTVLAQKLNEIQNPAQRTAASMELFGKQGPQILAVANELEKVRQITDAIGFGLSDRELQSLDEASDSLDQLKVIWDAGIKKAVATVSEYIVAIVKRIKEGIVAAGGFDGIWQKIKSVANTVLNIMLAIAAVMAIRMVAAAIAFAGHLARALVTARGISTVLARTPIGLITAGLAFAADKLGIDIVGGFTDALDLSLDLKGAQDQINQALDDKNASLNQSNDLIKEFTDEQKKALDALDELVNKQQVELQYQKDILQFGEKEAAIRKAVADEQQKLLKTNLDLSANEVASRLKVFEANERNKDSLKNQVTAQRELISSMDQLLFSTSSFAKEVNGLRDLKLQFQGFSKEDIAKMDSEFLMSNKKLQEQSIKIQENRIQKEFLAEIGKYNQLAAVELKYTKDKAALLEIQTANALGQVNLSIQQETLLADAKVALEKQYQADRIKAIEEANAKIYQIELSRIQNQLMQEKSAIAQSISSKDQEILQSQGENERQKQYVASRIEFEKKSTAEKTAFAIDQGAQMFNALGAQNKKAFEAAKAFNVANALMNAYLAIVKTMASVPFPLNLVASAAIGATAFAQVAQIRSQQYSGRALGGPVMGGTPYIVGESGPELFTPNTTGSITRNSDLGGGENVSVNFTINAVDTAGFDELLISRRGLITQVISDAMTEKGQRGL